MHNMIIHISVHHTRKNLTQLKTTRNTCEALLYFEDYVHSWQLHCILE